MRVIFRSVEPGFRVLTGLLIGTVVFLSSNPDIRLTACSVFGGDYGFTASV